MDVVRYAIEKPVSVTVGVILVVLFGVIGLAKMPYQLTPSVEEPEITVTTAWAGATPYEAEREIVDPQEKVLKGIPGLVEMESTSANNRGTVTLRFATATDVDDALLRVSNKLNEVPSYPENVEKPVVNATGAATSPVIWMILKTDAGNPNPIETYRTFFEEEVRQSLERVPGVADLFIGGGTERELHVVVSPQKLAAHGLTLTDVTDALRAANVNVSAGTVGVGRRDYRVRSVAEFSSPAEAERVVLRSTGQRRVLLSDVAEVRIGFAKRTVAMIHNHAPGIAVGVKPEPGTNILTLTDRVEQVVRELNGGLLRREGIHLDWTYDQRPYIRGAIDLVKKDVAIGVVLAVLVLLAFLGSVTSTVIVASAIPISVIGSFIVMWLSGRTLNVVSLAGISFAVGMFIDNAIVVLENIDRHRAVGKSAYDAAYDGAREVWGAIFLSTATNVAVFLPVVFVVQEVGQLFRDIAIAVSLAVGLSLFVSALVIPMLAHKLFRLTEGHRLPSWPLERQVTRFGERLLDGFMAGVRVATRNAGARLATVLGITALSFAVTWAMFPKMEYLPQGNRNLVINILVPPPGLSYEEQREIGRYIFEESAPYFGAGKDGVPGIRAMFYVGSDFISLFGALSADDQKAGALIPLFRRVMAGIPGVFGISNQAGIFQTRLGRGRTIDVDISGNDLAQVVQAAEILFGTLKKEMPAAQVRPIPSMEVTYPEVRFHPHRDRLKAAGLTETDLGIATDILLDGRKVGEYRPGGEKAVDLVVRTSEADMGTPERLHDAPVATPRGKVVPVSSLARMEHTAGIAEIRHLERKRTITLEVTPPLEVPLEEAMETIRDRILPPLAAAGMLEGTNQTLGGAADKLTEARTILQWNFLLALVITYLLMAALFENFLYPFIILFTIPLSLAGGFIGLGLVNLFIDPTPLDVLTMLGFVIMIGVVTNNAILIVHQALNFVRDHAMGYREAVMESTRTRIRPIYMAALTSAFGMLPLVVAPGPGSELYRGLGAVLLGGLAVSTFFTIYVIPAMLLLFVPKKEGTRAPAGTGEGVSAGSGAGEAE